MAKAHGRQPLHGRDPHEAHRASTPLELLYDLTYAVAFGVAANELAHHLAEGNVATAIVGFCFATFAVGWAWINYSWFGSAYDNDDWVCRLTTITFGMWWGYFIIPAGALLHAHRERAFGWGYGHMFVFGSLAAVGGGLHVAGYFLERHSELGATATVLSVAVPIAVYGAAMTTIYSLMTRSTDRFHLLLAALTVAVIALALGMAAAGVAMSVCLVVLAFAPAVTVVGYETIGHRHMHVAIERSISRGAATDAAP